MTGRRRALMLTLLLVMLPALVGFSASDVSSKQKEHKLKVGTQTLTKCTDAPRLWCGTFDVSLDRNDPGAGKIPIAFAWRPAETKARGTLVANEGGPGYPSIASYSLWRGMFGPLLKDHNLLMVDARGTGMSRPIDCKPLEAWDGSQSDESSQQAIADCGHQLDTTY